MNKFTINRRAFLVTGVTILASTRVSFATSRKIPVTIENLAFSPAEIQVRAGDVIEWKNNDPIDHTATVKDGWEVMIPAGTSGSHVVEASDNVDYYCRFHPNMKGRITVTS